MRKESIYFNYGPWASISKLETYIRLRVRENLLHFINSNKNSQVVRAYSNPVYNNGLNATLMVNIRS